MAWLQCWDASSSIPSKFSMSIRALLMRFMAGDLPVEGSAINTVNKQKDSVRVLRAFTSQFAMRWLIAVIKGGITKPMLVPFVLLYRIIKSRRNHKMKESFGSP